MLQHSTAQRSISSAQHQLNSALAQVLPTLDEEDEEEF